MKAQTINVSGEFGTLELQLERGDDVLLDTNVDGHVRIRLPLYNFEAHAITQALKPIVAARGQEVLQ